MDGVNRMYGPDYSGAQTGEMWGILGFIVIVGLIVFLVNWVLRKTLGVRRKKFFAPSSNYVNSQHQKGDAYFRWGGAAIFLIVFFLFYEDGPFVPFMALVVMGLLQDTYTAYMEKKHSDNPNDYKFTLMQFPIALIIVFISGYIFLPNFIDVLFDGLE